MCLLTFMNENTTADIDQLRVGAENNPDGFGFAVHAGSHIIRHSGLEFERVLDRFLKARAQHSGPALFHSRITTHGGTSLENCHPFQVGRDRQTVMAHNGMLPIDAKNGKSDTRIFAETMFPSWGGAATLNSKKMRKKLSKFANGSKLVFLSANPDVNYDWTIINEKDGHWDGDVWWSNNSYKWGRTSYTSTWTKHSSKVFGWATDAYDWDDEDWEEWESYNGTNLMIPAGNTEDCSYVHPETGELVQGEIWECMSCGHEEYVSEARFQRGDLDYCPACDSCWYCADHRRYCVCFHDTATSTDNNQPTLWGYDKAIEMGSAY